jgi:hypothetical protein
MAKYGYSVYGGDTYGLTPKLNYSVEPMSINVIDFSTVYLTWQSPSGDFSRFRLLRSQNGYPETAEDGVIIFEQSSSDGSSLAGSITSSQIYDGMSPGQIPIRSGRNIYYRVFLYTADKIWVKAGQISEVVPENTGALSKAINLLPRVVTSYDLSPLSVISEYSDLYKFLDALSFSYEQMMTEIKLSRPSYGIDNANYKTIPGETLNVGLTIEPNLPMRRQRALIREAIYLYSNKGTAVGISDYAESLTGFAPNTTVSSNLMLSVQDSTFYQSTGRWVATNATLSATEEMIPSNATKSIDLSYTLKIVPSATGSMSLGLNDPINQGVPIKPSTSYVYKMNIKCPTSGGATFKVEYYDSHGVVISNTTQAISATNSWQTATITHTSPSNASYVVLYVLWATTNTYYVDMVYVGLAPFVEYEEARAVTVELLPKLENYIPNPSFEVNTTGWSATGGTLSRDNTDVPVDGYPSSYSGKLVAVGAWTLQCTANLTLETGSYFTVSQYLKSANITSVEAHVDLYDVDNNLLSTSTETLPVTNSWVRQHTTLLIPADSAASYAKYRLTGTAGTLHIDMVMAEDTFNPTDYFDGSMPELNGVVWEGTAHNSTSLYYPNKSIKFFRLANTLNEWIPMNTFWRITTPAGLEYTNLTV